jgi:hypothetical protein
MSHGSSKQTRSVRVTVSELSNSDGGLDKVHLEYKYSGQKVSSLSITGQSGVGAEN